MVVVECLYCGTELIRVDNGSSETFTARLPCLDDGCEAKKRGSKTNGLDMTEDADEGFPASPDERLFLSHLREISGKVQ